MIAAHGGAHGRGLPWLAPIRNSSELRGLCCRSCFGPRMCGRSIAISSKRFGALNQGFPFSLLQCRQGRTRMGGWEAQRKSVRCMQYVFSAPAPLKMGGESCASTVTARSGVCSEVEGALVCCSLSCSISVSSMCPADSICMLLFAPRGGLRVVVCGGCTGRFGLDAVPRLVSP